MAWGKNMIIADEKCYVCGKITKFTIDDRAVLYREAMCENCGANIRNSDTAKTIVSKLLKKDICLQEAICDLKSFKILGTCSSGSIHSVLKQLPGYICGEYFDDIKSGESKDEILCIDLKKSHFEAEYFDMVITEDVLEHIDDINRALREINRILKMNGLHIFTVPFHQKRRTLDRSCLQNKVYHGDPIRPEGALVYTDFGQDIESILEGFGMKTERFMLHEFHSDDEITNVDVDYDKYCVLKDQSIRFFKYNSVVFCSTKYKSVWNVFDSVKGGEREFTGERFIPGVHAEITGEHLHRYYAILDLLKDKVVVDAACGEGYGSFILSQQAKQVYGIDIDKTSILRAQDKYDGKNVSYANASIEKLPFEDQSIDVVVSFETIEHVNEKIQQQFLKEAKRVLKKDGILIISTPDKAHYSDKLNYQNEFHIKEFYFDEFQGFLSQWFSNVYLYNQGFESLSIISSQNQSNNGYHLLNQQASWKMNNKRYIIAICSNIELAEKDTILSLMHQDGVSHECNSMKILELYHAIQYQSEKIRRQQDIIFEQCKTIVFQQVVGKKIIFFGTGSAVKKICAHFPAKVDYYVDNNQQKWGSTFEGATVYPPQQILEEDKNEIAVIVASQYFTEISNQLQAMGFKENVNFWNGYELFAFE